MEKYTEKLARAILIAASLILIGYVAWYFRTVLVYVLVSVIVALLAKPLMALLRKVKIRKKPAPEWLLASISLCVIMLILVAVVSGMVPVVNKLITQVSAANIDTSFNGLSASLRDFNRYLITTFGLERGFKIENVALDNLKSLLDIGIFGSVLGSVASTVANVVLGLVSVLFIAFFFIKDDTLFTRIVSALTPDRFEEKVIGALGESNKLLTRYFVGLVIEMTIVGAIDFVGLWAVARLDFGSALGIGFIAGIINVIPYVGPLLGGVIGTVIGLTLKYCSAGMIGLDVSFWTFVMVLVTVFVVAQVVDVYVLQPMIYSTTVKASPLEIFIVLLMAGTMGGAVGMLVAIPAYTVLRVFSAALFPDVKVIKRLTQQ